MIIKKASGRLEGKRTTLAMRRNVKKPTPVLGGASTMVRTFHAPNLGITV
jgi:hypothetical protein